MKPSILILLAALLASQASARTWHVLNDGSGDAPTVQAGIDSAAAGDTVLVMSGRYVENIDFLGKGISVVSQSGAEVTILDGSGDHNATVVINSQEGAGATLDGFTVTGGQGYERDGNRYGGGIHVLHASPTIRNSIISGNRADWGGGMHGGVPFAFSGSTVPVLTIEDNVFESNVAGGGGGLRLLSSESLIVGNVFRQNSTNGGDGGGLGIRLNVGTTQVVSNTFYENTADDKGGGIHVYMSRGEEGPINIRKNVFVRNVALGAGTTDAGAGGGLLAARIRGEIDNNTFVANEGIGESSCGGGGIELRFTTTGLAIRRNIFAGNQECGIACRDFGTARFEGNLLWNNSRADIGIDPSACPVEWNSTNIFANPQFCSPEADDYSVAASSPALIGEETIGAFDQAGCPPVGVKNISWGRIKAKYRN